MSQSVQMPALGESVTEGTVTQWLKKEGEQVTEDEPLLEVSTDKVDTEVPAPFSGVLEKILVGEDETVDIGADLAIIGDGSGTSSADNDNDEEGSSAQGRPAESASSESEATATQSESEPDAQADAESRPDVAAAPAPEDEPAPDAGSADGASSDSASSRNAPSDSSASDNAAGTEVTMPEMGESVTEGTITHWIKQVGDWVAVDDPLVEIATDKVDAEVPSPVAGTLIKILAGEDDTVEVGEAIAIVGEQVGEQGAPPPDGSGEGSADNGSSASVEDSTGAADSASEARPDESATPAPAAPAAGPERSESSAPTTDAAEPAHAAPAQRPTSTPSRPPAAAAATPPAGPTSGGGYVTPVVRKLAADNGVELAAITGSGVGGRIRREDVLAAAKQQGTQARKPAAPRMDVPSTVPISGASPTARPTGATRPAVTPDANAATLVGTTQPTSRIQQAMARSVMGAVTTSAQTTTMTEVDVTRVVALRAKVADAFTAREHVHLTFLPFFVKAAIEAAKALPVVNASLADDLSSITYHPTVNAAITVDTAQGQMAPVIQRADDLNVGGLARHIADLADRTRAGAIGPQELSGATLTVTNAGSLGALIDHPIVAPPQAAALAIGSVVKRAVVVTDTDEGDVIAVRSMASLALTYDQRLVDSATAAKYLATVKARIEDGEFEADLGVH